MDKRRTAYALFVSFAIAPLAAALFACGAQASANGFDPNEDSGSSTNSPRNPGTSGGGPRDGSTAASDGGPDETPDGAPIITCGGSVCRDGETCDGGACVNAGCVGYTVPGDFSTLQNAVTAVEIDGGTICVNGPINESLNISTPKALTIIGATPSTTVLSSMNVTAQNGSNIDIEGVTTTVETTVNTTLATVRFANSSFSSSSGYGLEIYGSGTSNVVASKLSSSSGSSALYVANTAGATLTVNVDACDISNASSATGSALEIGASDALSTTLQLSVTNSYIHDASYGVYFHNGAAGYALNDTVSFINDTFAKNGTAIYIAPSYTGLTTNLYNNLLANNTLGISLSTSATTIADGNNCLSNNTSNYQQAIDGPNYVKGDALLDTSTPPALGTGSPCRAAGDKAHASDHDYWGRARGTSIDIGAVQSTL